MDDRTLRTSFLIYVEKFGEHRTMWVNLIDTHNTPLSVLVTQSTKNITRTGILNLLVSCFEDLAIEQLGIFSPEKNGVLVFNQKIDPKSKDGISLVRPRQSLLPNEERFFKNTLIEAFRKVTTEHVARLEKKG